MSEYATLVLDFGEEESSEDCPLMYVEIPENEVQAGDEVEIRLWGPAENLQDWTLCAFGQSLGTGTVKSLKNPDYTEQVDLAESLEAQLEYPLLRFLKVMALTPLTYIDENKPFPPKTWRRKGAGLAASCSRKGYSCLQVAWERPLYGSLEVTYERVATYRAWTWTVPKNYAGDVWFFLYNDRNLKPYRKFAVELPELASVEEGVRNLSIKTLDFSTEAAIPGAAIYLNNKLQGHTDAEGLLHLTDVPTGEHLFRATREGYLDTDQDGLSNESIVVA